MENYADLEIRILDHQAEGYPVELTLNNEQEFPRGYLDPAFLPWIPSSSPENDGVRIFDWLFADAKLKTAWAEVRGLQPLRRLRLRIDTSVPELHAIPWEIVRDPGDGSPPIDLAASSATPFSRYWAGRWQPGAPILQRPIRVLVAIASPADASGRWNLDPIDINQEWNLLQDAVKGLEIELSLMPQPCTLPALEGALKNGCHVLHFIGHGVFNKTEGQTQLYLADAVNQIALVSDEEFAGMLARQLADTAISQDNKLRLVFLASCQTATRSPADAFRGLAPQLVTAGVPAVLAMQDKVAFETARQFAATFYRQLLQHGLVDLASNEARSALLSAGLPGASIPVLFMRLHNGQLLGNRGMILGDRSEGFWTTLLQNIEDKYCTPILGPLVTTDLLPTPVDLARELATEYNYPFLATESLPRVAQFVATLDNRRLREELIRKLVAGYKSRMGLKPDPLDQHRKLSETISESNWSELSRTLFESEIHHQLADLNLPLYLTTNLDNFMTLALNACGRPARQMTIDLTNTYGAQRPYPDLDPPPSPENPVVLNIFGTDQDLRSLVLTEDDYLDYLARISRDYGYLIPHSVDAALASTTLLILGYRLQDLDMKVILRGVLANLDLKRWNMLHVAVQIEAEMANQALQEEATRYFRKYFADSRIDVYWGTAQQFVADLHSRWQEVHHG